MLYMRPRTCDDCHNYGFFFFLNIFSALAVSFAASHILCTQRTDTVRERSRARSRVLYAHIVHNGVIYARATSIRFFIS